MGDDIVEQPRDVAVLPPSVPAPSLSGPVAPIRHRKRKVTELRCGEVRWFYRRKGNDQKWLPFKGLDSLKLELRFRELHKIEVDAATQNHMIEHSIKETTDVVVLDGLYKTDATVENITALYWKDDSAEIRRGTWFLPDSQPLRPDMADIIEKHHLQHFRGQTIPDGASMFSDKEASKKPQLTELQHDNFEVKWSSVIDIFLFNTSKTTRFLRYLSWGKPPALRRGYEKEAEWTDGDPAVSHLILVVHGIGQKGYENLIAENTAQVRDSVYEMLSKHFPDEKSRPMFLPIEWRSSLKLDNGITDVITLPKMSSMRETLNSTAMDIMYYQSPLYRKEIIAGVVKQMNSVYSQFMANNPTFSGPISIYAHSLGSVITYDILSSWSPLILYDTYVTKAIDEHMSTELDEDSKRTMKDYLAARDRLHESVSGGMNELLVAKDEQLIFKVKYLFAVGSPLAVFLVMRGAERQAVLPDKAKVDRIFNIFHPYDPVAYRLEPLFANEFRNIRPVKLYSNSDPRGKNPYDDLPLELHKQYVKKLKAAASKAKKEEAKNGDAKSEDLEEEDEADSDEDEVRSACSSPRSLTPPPPGEEEKPVKRGWFWSSTSASTSKTKETKEKDKDKDKAEIEVAKEVTETAPPEKKSDLEKLLEKVPPELRPPKRLDFSIQPSLTEKSYWSVLKSHFAYWLNTDIALFLVNVLYEVKHIKPEPLMIEAPKETKVVAAETKPVISPAPKM